MNKALFLCFLLAFGVREANALRPYNKGAEARVSWMILSSPKTGQEYYMEVAADGAAVVRTATKDAVITKRGKIPAQLVKDLFREIEISEIINSQGGTSSRMVFYKDDVLNISVYIHGELRMINSPLNKFGEAFSYAFGEVKKAAAKLADDHALKGFLLAKPLEGDELEQFQLKASKGQEIKIIETYDIQKVPSILKAIKQPHRMIPLETTDEIRDIQSFIATQQLYGLGKIFYLPSTRGTYECRILDADKAPASKSLDKPKAKAAAPGKKRVKRRKQPAAK